LILGLLWPVIAGAQDKNQRKEKDQPIHATANHAKLRKNGNSVLTGDVHMHRGGQSLQSNKLIYNRNNDTVCMPGTGTYNNSYARIMGQNGQFNLNKKRGDFHQARYHFLQRNGRGKAKYVQIDSKNEFTLHHATYTTCPTDHQYWLLTGSSVDIDRSADQGTARNVVLHFMGVPFFYSPYLSFPISDKRKSGFLVPTGGVSSDTGFDLTTPYYLNLAPNYDATLTPRIMSKRGVELGGQFRYLTGNSHGSVEGQYLPRDLETKNQRDLIGYKDETRFTRHLGASADYTRVSDIDYFRDLGSQIGVSSTSTVLQQAMLSYQQGDWLTLRGRLQGYQMLKRYPRHRPYDRLPEISLHTRSPVSWLGFRPTLDSDFTYFHSHRQRVVGSRVNLNPGIAFDNDHGGWFVRSKATYQYTAYRLHDTAPGKPAHPTRGLPIVDVDTGLRLERSAWHGWMQTIEPRLYYLYVPYRDQSDLPAFYGALPDFLFPELFRRNLFSGIDRMENANQITAAVTTRFINTKTGKQRLKLSLGEIYRFDKPRVTLPPALTDPFAAAYHPYAHASNVVGGLQYQITDNLALGVTTQFDPHSNRFDRNHLSLQYHGPHDTLLNLGYRFRRGAIKQTDISFLLPVTKHWGVIGRWNYSLRADSNIETLAGIQYENCCYAIRAAYRRYQKSDGMDTGFYVQLDLKGLTRLGNQLGSLLKRDIIGY
jgi:LPS-assembly protein